MKVQCSSVPELHCSDGVSCVIDILPKSTPSNMVNLNNNPAPSEYTCDGNSNCELADSQIGTEDKPYRCHICGKLFSRNSSLKCHIRLHIEGPENILRGNSNSSINDLPGRTIEFHKSEKIDREETYEVIEETSYCCVFCDKRFSQKSSLKCHIQFHIETFRAESGHDGIIDISEKQTPYRKNSSDNEGSPQTSPGKEYACVICDQQFSRKSSLIMHYKNHPVTRATEDELQADQFCRKFTIDIVKQEEANVYDARKCSITTEKNAVTMSKSDQNTNDYVEGDDKQYKCYICDKQFARNSSLAWHIQFHETHMYSKLKKSSDTCPENIVKNTNDLHVEDDDFQCQICGKVYHSNSSLRRHMLCHGELPVVNGDMTVEESPVSKEATCKLCNRTFKNVTSLKKHFVQMHRGQQMNLAVKYSTNAADDSTGEFKCDMCDRSYFALNSLRRHVLNTHQSKENLQIGGGKMTSYKCNLCSKLFDSIQAKNTHMAHHESSSENATDESLYLENADGMYECHFCDQTFDHKNTLNKHIQSHNVETGDNSDVDLSLEEEVENESLSKFDCPYCERVFENKKGLSRHIGYHNSLLTHLETKELTECKYCNKNFETVRAMRIHAAHAHRDQTSDDVNLQSESEVEVTEPSQFECSHCDRVFDSKRARSSHTSQAHKSSENQSDSETEAENEKSGHFKCFKCSRVFHNRRARSSHAAQVHRPSHYRDSDSESDDDEEPEQYECLHCDRVFDSRRARSSHASQAHRPVAESEADLHRCAYCERLFDSSRAMNIHASAQHKDQVTATRALSNESLLDVHQCDVCHKKFDSLRALSVHGATRHAKDNGDSESENASQINSNLMLKTTDRQLYSCPECPKTFAHPNSVSRHLRDHKLERERSGSSVKNSETTIKESPKGSMKCGLCAKTFINVKALAGHMKIHSKTVPEATFVESNKPLMSPTLEEAVCLENSTKTFACRICDKTFSTVDGLDDHIRIHPDTISQTETFNEFTTPVKEELSITNSDEEETYTCDICKASFSDKQHLEKHMKNHMAEIIRSDDDSIDPFQCRTCGRQYNGEKSLKTHMYRFHRELIQQKRPTKFSSSVPIPRINSIENSTSKHDKDVYKCDRCDQMFINYREYKSHSIYSYCTSRKRHYSFESSERSISNELFKCKYCDQSFLLHCHLQKHLKSRCNAIDLRSDLTTERDGVEVPLPSKRPRRSTFISPLYEYDPIGSYKCDECEKSFTSRFNWQRHLSAHKAALQKRENSTSTTKLTFSFRRNGESVPQGQPNLEAQFREMPYECVYCEKCFKEKELLLEHVRMHAEANELEGDELNEDEINFHAGEHFVIENSEGDEEHFIFEQHDDNEGYQCNECEDNYKDKLQMIIHMSYHLNSKLPPSKQKSLVIKADSKLLAPYACRFCNQRFINKSYRINHLRAHHLNDIFQCDICQKMFLCKSNLKLHCEQHMIDTKHRCEYCYKYFSSPWFLLRHTKIVHGKKRRCKNCGFQSKSKSEMDEHSCTLHTMDTKTCEHCLETFLEEEDWIAHMQTHNL